MPEMDYSLIHRTPDGNGKILVTTPGSPDKGSWETEAELKTYVNQDAVMKTDIVQSLGQQLDKVPSNKAVDDAINAIIRIHSFTEEHITDSNGFWVAPIPSGATGFCLLGVTTSQVLGFGTFANKTRISQDEVDVQITDWSGTPFSNEPVTCTVYYVTTN